jgi:hypothetical protein
MFSLTYVSAAVRPFSAGELLELLVQCNRNNRLHDVTGMLLYKDGNFMQALEGDELIVKAVHATISVDPRHRGLITLLRGFIPERQFPSWSMGFKDLGSGIDLPEGYSEFLNVPLIKSDSSRAQKLLLTFKEIM